MCRIHATEIRNWKECSLKTKDESGAKQPRVHDPTAPDPGGVQSSSPPVATPSPSFDVAAANRLAQAGVTFIAFEARSNGDGRAYAVKLGHESARSMSSIEARTGCRVQAPW